MLATRFTELVGCSLPIQQAGMGAASPPELAAAVSKAGGLGMIGTARPGGDDPELLASLLERTRTLTSRPFGVNFILIEDEEPFDPACFELAASAARVVEFFLWAPPDPALFNLIHQRGALVACQIGSREQAVAAAESGCDLIIAQGIEAGGHVRGTIGLLALLSDVLDAVDVPVLAAGGIGNGRALAAALAAGADGVRIGTRLLAAEEADIHPIYREALLQAQAVDTIYTDTFSVGWHAPHRVLRSCITAAEAFQGDRVAERASLDGSRLPVRLRSSAPPDSSTVGTIKAMALYAGESVGSVRSVQPAAQILDEIAREAESLLRRW